MEYLLVYTPQINNRVDYILTQILFRVLRLDFMVTSDTDEFIRHEGPKLSYHHSRLCNEVLVKPSGLLYETDIRVQEIHTSEWNGTQIFYHTEDGADLPFDIFSAAFYLLSRYEEYYPFQGEKFGRFDAANSLAYREGFLAKPVIDNWSLILKGLLIQRFPDMEFPDRRFGFLSTIDIDNPFAFLHKGFFRTTGALLKSLVRFDIKAFISRILTLQGARKDPFETYDYIHSIEKKYGFKSVYFFLVGDYGRYDTAIPVRKLAYQNLIIDIHTSHPIGLHSSFNSNKSFDILRKEKNRLIKIINEPIIRSRQHYLMLNMPETYLKLIEAGIREDYSMGYASAPGFRAGTCTPFKFFDLARNEETKLLVYPFQVMEVTLHNYMRLRSAEAFEPIKRMIDEVKSVNGLFIPLWHNESLSEYGMWLGWRKVFEEMVKYAVKKEKS